MAVFYPSLADIENDRMEKHTEGEMRLLRMLAELNDSFLVYYQPHINYAHPDIIIARKCGGVLIIEVKDWHMPSYNYCLEGQNDRYGYLQVSGENVKLKTPFQQVEEYKDEMYNLLCPELYAAKVGNAKVYGIVKTAVYFSCSKKQEVNQTFSTNNKLSESHNEKVYDKYTVYWCDDDPEKTVREQICSLLKVKPNSLFTDFLFEKIKGILKPSEEWLEQMQPFILDDRKKELAVSHPGRRTRVRGVAGSGKTLVIAQKAINCYNAKHKPVLILTYNITLKNYIRDKIAQNTRNMSQFQRSCAFEIIHIDSFLIQVARRYELKMPPIDQFRDEAGIRWEEYRRTQMDIIRGAKSSIDSYDTVLIDEAQDYESEWFRFIEDVFTSKETEMLVAADEKQNIYGRQIEQQDKLPVIPGFSGRWQKLGKSYRLTAANARLAVAFQRCFYAGKYIVDEELQVSMLELLGERKYYDISDAADKYTEICRIVHQYRQTGDMISPNDICILNGDMDVLRRIDAAYRKMPGNPKTACVSENQETYEEICRKYNLSLRYEDREIRQQNTAFQNDLNRIRTMKKFAFTMNTGTVKICTVHSFKGWEINTVVLILNQTENKDELIYTAITRAKQNLIVIDLGNEKYGGFFRTMDRV